MTILNFRQYSPFPVFIRMWIVLFFIFSANTRLHAQTLVPTMDEYIGDQGNFIDQSSEIILNDMLREYEKESGFKIYIVTVAQAFCNYSPEDAKVILETITKENTNKCMLMYLCNTEDGTLGTPVFQYFVGTGWNKKLNPDFFQQLQLNVINYYSARYMNGNAFIVSVKLIQQIEDKNTEVDFEEISKSLEEAPIDAKELSKSQNGRFGKTDEADLGIRIFVFLLFLTILGIGAVYAMRTRGLAAWFLFIFMTPFWLLFFTIVIGDSGWMMTVVYAVAFIGGRIMVANNNWWFQHKVVLRHSGAFAPPMPMITEAKRRMSNKRFEGRGSKGSWEQDYE